MNRGKLLAGALGDLSDHSSARTTGDFALNLANAEVGGRSKRFDLTDDALLGGWPAQMLSSDLGGPHAGGHAFADERGLQFGHGADDGEHRSTHWAVGVYLILTLMKRTPRWLNSSSATNRWRVLRAKRSNFQTSTQSISWFRTAAIKALS